jgi:hypothetical protein
VYLTKILYGVPYVDVIKIIERVEERHLWDQQLLQGTTNLFRFFSCRNSYRYLGTPLLIIRYNDPFFLTIN